MSSNKQGKKLIVMLHGYGGCGANMQDLSRVIFGDEHSKIDVLCLDAPLELPEGGRCWFNINLQTPLEEKIVNIGAAIQENIASITSYINGSIQKRGFTLEDTVLFGFSQGGMIALEMAGTFNYLGVSVHGTIYANSTDREYKTKRIYWGHGGADDKVSHKAMHIGITNLSNQGVAPMVFEERGVAHIVGQNGQHMLRQFVESLL